MCKCKKDPIKMKVKKHSEYASLERNGDLIDLNFCGLEKVFDGDVKQSEEWNHLKYPNGSIIYSKDSVFRVSLGISANLPKGKSVRAYMRSSTRKNFNVILTNHVGCLDYTVNPYNGTDDIWRAEFYALDDGIMEIGDRILQFEIIDAMPEVEFEFCDSLEENNRGGYGSTGI